MQTDMHELVADMAPSRCRLSLFCLYAHMHCHDATAGMQGLQARGKHVAPLAATLSALHTPRTELARRDTPPLGHGPHRGKHWQHPRCEDPFPHLACLVLVSISPVTARAGRPTRQTRVRIGVCLRQCLTAKGRGHGVGGGGAGHGRGASGGPARRCRTRKYKSAFRHSMTLKDLCPARVSNASARHLCVQAMRAPKHVK